MKKYMIAFFALSFLYAYSGCKQCKRITDPVPVNKNVKILGEDIVYAERQVIDLKTQKQITVQLKMDIVCHTNESNSSSNRPLVIFFHGYNLLNYYKHVDESYKYYNLKHGDLMLEFARKHNCVVALVDYITSPLKWEDGAVGFTKKATCKNGSVEYVPLIDSLEEQRNQYFMYGQAKEAVRFLKSRNSEYNFDINNITLVGYSAGGILAAGAGFINNSNYRPTYSYAQPDVIYNTANPYPQSFMNVILLCLNSKYGKSYAQIPTTFPNPIPRIDLGSIEGNNTTRYNSSVKNVALLCSGLPSSISVNPNGPRLFIFGHDNDNTLKDLRNEAAVSCSNKRPFSIFSEIKAKAVAAGYVENVNLKVIESNTNSHEYKTNGTLAGSYPDVVEAIWAFIK